MKKVARIHISEGGAVDESSVAKFEGSWKEFEAAYGRKLSVEVRTAILIIVRDFISYAPFEKSAPKRNDALDRVVALRKGALSFKKVLTSRGSLSDAGSRLVNVLLRQEIRKLAPPRIDLSTSLVMASRFVTACDRLLMNLKHQSGFAEGDAWNSLISRLTEALSGAGLPTGATQSRDKKSTDTPSAFVALVTAMQKKLPHELQRHYRADAQSLAKEINRARQPSRHKARIGKRPRAGVQPQPPDRLIEKEIFRYAAGARRGTLRAK